MDIDMFDKTKEVPQDELSLRTDQEWVRECVAKHREGSAK
jgi:hypothetical protein